jgi:micrococcal nuclease
MPKQTNSKQSKNLYILLALLLNSFVIAILLFWAVPPETTRFEKLSDNYVVRVIDGDTFEIYSGEKVRLICVDTPERGEDGFEEATRFLEELVLNKEVRLEKDVSERDKYDRLLRYVFVSASGKEVFVNKEIVKVGYGEIMRVEPDTKLCDEIESK